MMDLDAVCGGGAVLALALAVTLGCEKGDGDDLSPSCQAFKSDMSVCMDRWCSGDGSGHILCECWERGGEPELPSCACVPLDWEQYCRSWETSGEYEAGSLDCTSYTDMLEGMVTGCE
jgi:hypothetical protein